MASRTLILVLCTSLRQCLDWRRIRAGQPMFRIDAVRHQMNMISEKSVFGRGGCQQTQVNQVPRRCPPVTITSMSFLFLNSIATFTVLVVMEMPLSTLRLRPLQVLSWCRRSMRLFDPC